MKNTVHVIGGASLGVALMLTACQPIKPNPRPVITSSVSPKTVAIDQPFTLRIGESALIAGEPLQITFVEVILDKRCPKEVSCAVAGEMKLQVDLEQRTTGKQKQAHMTTGQDNADDGFDWRVTFEGYVVQVIQVKPDASLNKKIDRGDYEVTLTVAPEAPPPSPTTRPTATPITPTPTPRPTREASSDTADKLEMVDGAYATDIVLRVADTIRKAHPGSPEAAYLNLKAALAAGDLVAALSQLHAMAEGANTLRVTALDDLGDAGVWVWQVLPKGHVATLLVANGHGLMALTTIHKINQNEPAALQQAHDQVEPLLSVWMVN